MSNSLGTLALHILVNNTGFKRGLQQAEQLTERAVDNMSDTFKDFRQSVADSLKEIPNAFNDFRQSIANSLNNTAIGSWASDLQTQFAGVNGSALTLSATLSGMAVGGAFVAFGAMSRLAIETANANMEIQKFANLANSSVITFQGLAGASELLGINQDKLADQLKDFNEKLGEFASVGAGGAMDFFEQIAVKTEKGAEGAKKLAKEMSKMNGVEALQLYVDKLEQAGVNQQQMSFYLESMGSDLTALIPILKDGGKLWKDYQTALEEAGVITSEEAIEKSALLQAQTKSLQLQYGALKSTLAEQMMPVLSNTISHFTTGSKQGGQFTGILTGLTAVAKGVAVVMVGLNTVIETVVHKIRLAVENFTEVGIMAKNVFSAVANQDLAGVTLALSNGFNNIGNNTALFADNVLNSASRAMKSFGDILSDNTAKSDKLAQSIHSISQATQNSVKQNQGGFTGGIAQNKALNEAEKAKQAKEKQAQWIKSRTIDAVIASGEGDYRSYNRGRAGDSVRNPLGLDITKMTIGQIMQRQAMKGSQRLFAVGKYQVIPDTMKQAVQALNLDRNALFDEQMQERILTEFLLTAKKSRGAIEQYIKGQSNNVNTALHQLSLEFASIANPFTGKSSYDKDKAGNSASISVAKAKAGLEASRKLYAETLANTGNAQLAWKRAFSGYAEMDKNSDNYKALMEVSVDQQKALEEQAKKQHELLFKYMPEAEQKWHEHLQSIEQIKQTFANDQARQEDLIQKERLRYLHEFNENRAKIQVDYMSEAEKITQEHQQRLKQIENYYQPSAYDNQETVQTLANLKSKYIEQETNRFNQQLQKIKNAEIARNLEYEKLQLDVKRYLLDEEQIIKLEYEIKIKEVDLLDENEQFKQARKDILSHEANKRMQEIQNEKSVKENAERENTWSKYQERFATAENPYLNDLKLLQETRQQMLITEQEYHNQRLKLQTQTGLAVGQAFASSLAGLVDESSSAYSALFAIQKAFSVASVLMSSTEAISKAWASAPFPYNLPAVATATVQTGALQAIISAISPVGMAHNGMTNIPKEGTWLLDGGERVLNPKQNQDLTRFLQERNKQDTQQNTAVANNIKIVNSFDESMLVDAMNSRRGEQIILNVIKRNKSALGF